MRITRIISVVLTILYLLTTAVGYLGYHLDSDFGHYSNIDVFFVVTPFVLGALSVLVFIDTQKEGKILKSDFLRNTIVTILAAPFILFFLRMLYFSIK